MSALVDRIDIILQSGLNPIASVVKASIEVVNHAMSGVIDYRRLERFHDL